ncbi:MAG: bifunctional 5,10-methylenetetrahydrofolate dehydrogenase/5,10-methenyltetrahydrofolate cyclohydrolase [DPANN group archaeon]|nr:bifunctional 5,10-methylenetetrahydrofolate dehydrogenase/5,10-methenyltetrahydrofolate cyclohydrolase [DPANN group archaeon]
MPAELLEGKIVAEKVLRELSTALSSLVQRPGLAIIQVGEDPASLIYVRKKVEACARWGLKAERIGFPLDVTIRTLQAKIEELNAREDVDGIIVQLPLPLHLDVEAIVRVISPDKDVDGFHPLNIGLLTRKTPRFIPGTPLGILHMLKHHHIPVAGKHAVIVGRSNIVGRPLAQLLLNHDATVTVCHSKTKELASLTVQADILISAVGKPGLITSAMVKQDAVVIDVGTSRVDGKLRGDVDFEEVRKKASFITPVPGGVGPMTVAMLMKNTVDAYRRRH